MCLDQNNKHNTTLFYIGLIIKITLGTFLASYFLTDLFIPFVNYYVENNFSNPYQYFVNEHINNAFPYPALMLYIMAIPKILLGWLDNNSEISIIDIVIYRIPLLIADISILYILRSWAKEKANKLLGLYWLSPVLIYITYIHGQLDVIPISLLFASLYYMFKDKMLKASLFLGLALSTKTNIALTVPFFFLYLVASDLKIKNIVAFLGIVVGVFLTINLPYLYNDAFLNMVFQNQEQNKIFDFSFNYTSDTTLFLIPASMLLLFVRCAIFKNLNKNIFIMFLGFSFGIILLFIPPMQGWYYWFIPFLAYFYVKEDGRSPLLFVALQGLYLLYFIVSKDADYLQVFQFISTDLAENKNLYTYLSETGIDADKIVNLIFTLLQATLFMNCILIYKRGVESFSKHKITSTPYLVGIGGDSGVGKTTISNALQNIFSDKNTVILRGDDMHKWERGHDKWSEFTHLDPKANHLHEEIYQLKTLRHGKKIHRRSYDHDTGHFTKEYEIKPKNLTIFEGLHPFYLERQRRLYDLKIFLRPEEELARHWKIIRDVEKRGHTKDTVLKQIKKREKDVKSYIETQSEHADILIEALTKGIIENLGSTKEKVSTYFKIRIRNSIFIEPLIAKLAETNSLNIKHKYAEHDTQEIEIDGDIPSETIANIADTLISGLEDIGINHVEWPENDFGVLMLILTYCIFEEADHESN